jgi:hypothetical protein
MLDLVSIGFCTIDKKKPYRSQSGYAASGTFENLKRPFEFERGARSEPPVPCPRCPTCSHCILIYLFQEMLSVGHGSQNSILWELTCSHEYRKGLVHRKLAHRKHKTR